MTKDPLGRLERVDLRTYWLREDTDFTPWLGEEENIGLLGTTIGMDLEVQEQEASVGPFRADILCRNTADNSFVLIENQLERTDHTHLGQLLTYAAGLNAVTLVWVVERFTEEHRAALDWLNRITDEGFHFFGIEVELWRIGDSVPAPKFSVVAKPNDWAKTVREAATSSAPVTEIGKLRADYWSAFATFLTQENSSFRPPKAANWGWQTWGLGRTNFQLCAVVNMRDGEIAVYLNLGGPDAEAHYQLLLAQQQEIEAGFEFDLVWEKMSKERKLIIRQVADTADVDAWPAQQEWLHRTMLAFQRVFKPLVRELDATEWSEPSDD